MSTIVVIQARTSSTRLPGKVMYPLDGQPTLAHVINRVNTATHVDDTIVATSTESPDDVIEEYAHDSGPTSSAGASPMC